MSDSPTDDWQPEIITKFTRRDPQADLRAENKRLREALKIISKEHYSDLECCAVCVATAALKGEKI